MDLFAKAGVKMTITVDLTKSGLDELNKQLDSFKDKSINKLNLLIKTLAERGVEVAKAEIRSFPAVFTGELLDSMYFQDISPDKNNIIFVVRTDNAHAAFVEFGTGQTGKDNPYSYKLPDGVTWTYADIVNSKHIRQNPVTGKYYWFYPGIDGKYHYTEGLPARPYMHNTSVKLIEIVEQTAIEIFGGN